MAVCPVPGLMEALVCPGFHVVKIRWIPCHGDDAVPFELYRGEPSELAVTTLAVVPDLEVLECGRRTITESDGRNRAAVATKEKHPVAAQSRVQEHRGDVAEDGTA